MIQTVKKRDGRIVGFNEQKIAAAIRKAMLATEEGEDEALIGQIADRISVKGKPQMTVEAIAKGCGESLYQVPQRTQHSA